MAFLQDTKTRLDNLKANKFMAEKELEKAHENVERLKAVVHAHMGAIEQVSAIIQDYEKEHPEAQAPETPSELPTPNEEPVNVVEKAA